MSNSYVQIIIPNLATKIGLKESIVLSQLHYWLGKSDNDWVYNSYGKWKEQFPYWSISKIKRIFTSLEKNGYIIAKRLNPCKYDRTKYYTIDYTKLPALINSDDRSAHQEDNASCQTDPIKELIIKPIDEVKLAPCYSNKEYSKNTSKNNSLSCEMVAIWNDVFSKDEREKVVLTDLRIENLSKIINLFDDDLTKWREYCQKITTSRFLMGEITNFKASFDWAIIAGNICKIREGNYVFNDRKAATKMNEFECELSLKSRDPLWVNMVELFKSKYGYATTKSWLANLDFKQEASRAIISSNSSFIISSLKNRYQIPLENMLKSLSGGMQLLFEVEDIPNYQLN